MTALKSITPAAQATGPSLSPDEQRHLAIGEEIEKAAQEAPPEDSSTPEGKRRLAGKYDSVEQLEKAYQELQRKLGQKQPEDEEGEEGSQEPQEDASEDEQGQGPEADPEEPSEEQEEAVEPLSQEEQAEILKSIGGEEVYNQALEWAGQNYSPEEMATFNAIMDTQDKFLISMALRDMASRYSAQADKQGQLYRGREAKAGPKPFRSREEASRAMSDFRYQDDPAFRADVAARIAATPDEIMLGY